MKSTFERCKTFSHFFCLNNLWGSLWTHTYCGKICVIWLPEKGYAWDEMRLIWMVLYEIFSIISCEDPVSFLFINLRIRILLFCLTHSFTIVFNKFLSPDLTFDLFLYANKSLLKCVMIYFYVNDRGKCSHTYLI